MVQKALKKGKEKIQSTNRYKLAEHYTKKGANFIKSDNKTEQVINASKSSIKNGINKAKESGQRKLHNSSIYQSTQVNKQRVKSGIEFIKSDNKKEAVKNAVSNKKNSIITGGKTALNNKASELKTSAQMSMAGQAVLRPAHAVQGIRKQGLKNYTKKSALNRVNKLKSTPENKLKSIGKNAMQPFVKHSAKVAKAGKFIIGHWKLMLVCTIIAIFSYNLIPKAYAYGLMFNSSPHYYCNINADKEVKAQEFYKRYCTSGVTGGNESIAAAAVSLALNPDDLGATATTYVNCASHPSDPMATEAYVTIHDQVLAGDPYYASCDRGTCTAIRWAGADDNFPAGACGTQVDYLETSSKWENLGIYTSIDQLEPGDILINRGHIGIYLGVEAVQAVYPNSTYDMYAASYSDYCPKLQHASSAMWLGAHSYGPFTIYRNTSPEENSRFKDISLS